ncbi:hypothetical protein F5144DRAFT_557841, partial [Chaetomium tenue]
MGLMLGYLPVIEHFELHNCHMKCLPQLRGAFLRKFPSQLESIVESLLETIEIHTVDVLGQCNNAAPKTAEPHKRRKAGAKKTADTSHVPDRQHAASMAIRPSPVTEQMRAAPRPVTHQGSNLSRDLSVPEPGPPPPDPNLHLDPATPACPNMAATLNMWPDEGTETSYHTCDALGDFDALIAADGMSQDPVPGAGKEPADHPPMMFGTGFEDILSL